MKELPDGAHVKAQSKLPPFTHVVFCTGHGWANRAVATRLFTTHSGWLLITTHVATRQRVVERSSSPPNPFGVKLRAVAKVAFMAEAEVKAKEIIAVKEKAEAEAAAVAARSGGCREGCQGAGAG